MEASDNIYEIEPIISAQLMKIFKEEINIVYEKITHKYPEISIDDLNSLYNLEASKLAINLGVKKRSRKKLDKDKTCIGRKGDGLQCTRSKQTNSEFCLSHKKNLPHGRVDDEHYVPKTKGTRGRKRKDHVLENNKDYIPMIKRKIVGQYYLIDTDENLYTYDLEHPKFLGKINNEIC
jgi:hypothetical protein